MEGRIVRDVSDIRELPAKFNPQAGGHFAVIRGDAGYITAAAGAKVAIIKKWIITRSGTHPDGRPRLRFRAQFSYVNDALMSMKLQKRVVVQMKTRKGQENVDILAWDDWRYDGGVLTLENVLYFDAVVKQREVKR